MQHIKQFIMGKWWLPGITGVLLFIVWRIIFALTPETPISAESIFYLRVWMEGNGQWPLLLLIIGLMLSIALRYMREGITRRMMWLVGLLFVFFTLFVIITSVTSDRSETRIRYRHLVSLRHGGHVYNLAVFNLPGPSDVFVPGYVFFECDRLGLRCDIIFRGNATSSDRGRSARVLTPIITDETGFIQLYIGDELRYTHQPH